MKYLLITIAAVVLVGCGKSQPETPTVKAPGISIHNAAREGNIEAIKQHLAAGTDLNKTKRNVTPLHTAAEYGHKEIVELLITNGANVNAYGLSNGLTPLHVATIRGHNQVAELLITGGANVNAKSDVDKTPLDWAVIKKKTEAANLLR